MERQREQHEAARQIGSELYTAAFEACALPDAEKALLPIRQMGGYLDENGILQLPGAFSDGMTSASQSGHLYTFDPELAPDGRFLEVYADTVVRGYPQGLSLELAGKQKDAADAMRNHRSERCDNVTRHSS